MPCDSRFLCAVHSEDHKLIWFKPHDFSVKVMINKTKQMLFSRIFEVRAEKAQPFAGKKGVGCNISFAFKETTKTACFCFHFLKYIIDDLCGVLS